MQSAIEKSPNKHGPGDVESDAFQMSRMCSISREVSSLGENRLALARQFIAISFRILMNPVLISVLTPPCAGTKQGVVRPKSGRRKPFGRVLADRQRLVTAIQRDLRVKVHGAASLRCGELSNDAGSGTGPALPLPSLEAFESSVWENCDRVGATAGGGLTVHSDVAVPEAQGIGVSLADKKSKPDTATGNRSGAAALPCNPLTRGSDKPEKGSAPFDAIP